MINLAIFASGSGTNAENITKYFQTHPHISVGKIFANRPNAYVLKRAEKLEVPATVFNKEAFKDRTFLKKLEGIDYIILAGFLWLIPPYLLEAFPNKIINIHPALLPKFGGKGMYGDRVHQAVLDAGEKESGITIHLVNEKYDEGEVLFQEKCQVDPQDTPETLARKIHALEHECFPKVIEEYVMKNEDNFV